MNALQRIGVKIYASSSDGLALHDFIPVFHRWIQDDAIGGVLIDVADYSHLHAGPGIVLVAHEGTYSIDESDGERGLSYCRKQPLEGPLADRFSSVARSALEACRRLEEEPALGGRLRFDGIKIRLFANDRLHAPNEPQSYEAVAPALDDFLGRLYPGEICEVEREPDSGERFAVRARASRPVDVATLLRRL